MATYTLHLGMERMDFALRVMGLSVASLCSAFGFHRRCPS